MSQQQKPSRSLAGIAGIVAVATIISKIFGLVRQIAIAAAFGVGVAVDAYNYAYVIPGFLFILLGGINGPFHSAIVSVLARRDKKEAAPLVETITTLVGGLLLLVTV
ncbi:MAG: lipid II flippase MurJ, partial [Microcoleus sp. C1-bin4]|nr:lipid II flippase MurJ [Microcoleus sp. C1-bin4]